MLNIVQMLKQSHTNSCAGHLTTMMAKRILPKSFLHTCPLGAPGTDAQKSQALRTLEGTSWSGHSCKPTSAKAEVKNASVPSHLLHCDSWAAASAEDIMVRIKRDTPSSLTRLLKLLFILIKNACSLLHLMLQRTSLLH